MAAMVRIRPASAADGLAIAQIHAESWRTVYAGVLPAQTLAERTAPEAVAQEGEWRSAHSMDGVLIAEAPPGDGEPAVVGFAAFGPERDSDGEPGEAERTEHGRAELYAIFVVPRLWSTGTGRQLLDTVLHSVAASGYTDISLWVVEANARARRFYEVAGFMATGESVTLDNLHGVTEVRYRRLIG